MPLGAGTAGNWPPLMRFILTRGCRLDSEKHERKENEVGRHDRVLLIRIAAQPEDDGIQRHDFLSPLELLPYFVASIQNINV